MKKENKSIPCTYIENNYFRNSMAQFDMSAVCITSTGVTGEIEQVTIDNEDFEKLIAEYQRRQQHIKELNKELI